MLTTYGKLPLTALTIAMTAGLAQAECNVESGSIRVLGNEFDALQIIGDKLEQCASDSVEVVTNLTAEHESLAVPALTTDPAAYTIKIVANSSILPLLNNSLIRPLDDLVEAYGDGLSESQMIRINGRIMAIAFMTNSQHLWYRKDILQEIGAEVPATYEAFLDVAAQIRDAGLMQYPIAASYKPGWDLAEEFVNMYLGAGGTFFEQGSARLAIDNDEAREALEMMKSLSEFMHPDFQTFDTNEMSGLWRDDRLAMINGWGSRAGPAIDPQASQPDVAENTAFGATPTLGDGDIPASTLWWDGFSIAKNISDEDAEASFRGMMYALSTETAQEYPTATVWMIDGYDPSPAAVGVIANLRAGTRPYPMLPFMGLLHTALGTELAEYMQGTESADQALQDVARTYETAAKEAGFLD